MTSPGKRSRLLVHCVRGPRGASIVLVAIVLVVLCGCLALALDIGHLLSVRGELQNGADASALAAAWELNGTATALDAAQTKATQYAGYHRSDRLTVATESVEFGHWTGPGDTSIACTQRGRTNPDGYRFCYVAQTDPSAGWLVNAVRVVTARAGTTGGGPVSVFLGKIVNPADVDGRQEVRAESIAINGSPCSHGCPKVPFAVQYGCATNGSPGSLQCNELYYIGLSDATHDTAGWTSLSSSVPVSSTSICDIVSTTTACNVQVCDIINIGNGNNFTAQCGSAQAGTKKDLCEWFKPYVGQKIQVPIVSSMSQADCRAGKPPADSSCSYTGAQVIAGFATFMVNTVWCQGDTVPAGGCSQFAGGGQNGATQCIEVQLLCNETDPEPGNTVGCGWYGTVANAPRPVR